MNRLLLMPLLAAFVASPTLQEISACSTTQDQDGDGYTSGVDCDDLDASLHPGATDILNDGIDQDCSGTELTEQDGDGFASDLDCNDADAFIYPGAPDVAGDGVDTSCDGSDGLAPSVGLPTSTFTTIQAALDAATEGQTVWVGPGTYAEYGLSMKGKAVRLISTAGEASTVIDAQSKGTLFYFNTGETGESVLQGFTLTGGAASCNTAVGETSCSYSGGGIFIDHASPTLAHMTLTGNQAGNGFSYSSGYGGGMYLSVASPTLTHITFTGNRASGKYNGIGGGMYLTTSSPILEHITFTQNSTGSTYTSCNQEMCTESDTQAYGGGMAVYSSNPTLHNVTFTDNDALGEYSRGGGMYLEASSPSLHNISFTDNVINGVWLASGGGMYLYQSSPYLKQVAFTDNGVFSFGGGMYLDQSSPTLVQVTFTGNRAFSGGAGMYLYKSSPLLEHVTLTGNLVESSLSEGAGMYLSSSFPTLKNCILAYNQAGSGGNLYRYIYEEIPSTITARYSLIYNPSEWGADTFTPNGSYLTVEPKFLDYADTGTGIACVPDSSLTCLPADLHPALGSPLIDAGAAAEQDVDGSHADIGSYGGAAGGGWDMDMDGVPDYFWPGERADAPAGFNPQDFDLDDLDSTMQ